MLEKLALYPYPSIILIAGGFVSIIIAKIDIEEEKGKEKFLDLFVHFFAFCWGVTTLVWGILTFSSPSYTYWTASALIIVGLSLFLKPLKNIPWASLVSLLAAGGITAFLAGSMDSVFFLGLDLRWVLALVFFTVLFMLYLILKFIEDLFKLIGIILSNDPMALLIGIGGIVIGVAGLVF